MNIQVTRRGFLKGASAGAATTALGALGFGPAEAQVALRTAEFKLSKATETRNTCPYCSVSCGMLIYSRGDVKAGEQADIFHIEGDPDNPVNRGTLCPKGAGALDFIKSKQRVTQPMVRKPGSDKFEPIGWDEAMDRIARLMKEDRDANFIETNADGVTVNRWASTAFLAGCATSNETGWLTWKATRGLGMVQIDNQARI
jgi:formate dehydrogenase major subunit